MSYERSKTAQMMSISTMQFFIGNREQPQQNGQLRHHARIH